MDRKTKQMVCKLEGEPIQHLYADYEGLWLIYKKTPRCILYISTEYSAVSIGVHFDDIFLGSLRSVATEKDTCSGVWEINLNAIEGDTCGMHEIRVTDLRVGSGKPICCMLFGVLPKSQVIMSNPFCFGANSSVTVYDGTDKREVNICADNGCGFIDTKIGRMCVKPPCLRWRIDDDKWQMGCLEAVSWYRAPKFHNNVILEVDAPLDSNVELLLGDMRLKASSQGGNRYLLGDALQDSTAALVAINLKVGALTFQLFKMAFQPMLLSMPFISLDEGYLNFDAQNVFIGGNDSVLEVSLYDENDRQVLCYDTPVRSATATSLKDGYYSVKIVLWIETLINRARFALGTFKNISFGNPARFHFDGCRLRLKKTQCDKGKVRFEDTTIFRIQYLREDLHPVYQGTLSSPGAKSQTVQFIDLGRALRVYCNNCGEWEPANVDIQTKRLVNANADYKKVFPCKSVYYEEDQQNV